MLPIIQSRSMIHHLRDLGVVLFLAMLCVFFALKEPVFLGVDNLSNVLVQISGISIAAVGMTMVILTAGIDLSVGSILALSGCVGALTGLWMEAHAPAWFLAYGGGAFAGIITALATGALCGLVNGSLITRIHLPPFIATLGVMCAARGLTFMVSDSSPVEVTHGLLQIARFRLYGVPLPILIMVFIYIIGWILLTKTRFGRHLYAIGGSEESARLSGIPIASRKTAAYVAAGMTAAMSGLIVAARLAWMQPQEGDGFELEVIAAVVIGGSSLYGGQGSVQGTLLGALIMGVLRNGLNLMSMDYSVQKVIIGVIIIAAVSADVLMKRISKRA